MSVSKEQHGPGQDRAGSWFLHSPNSGREAGRGSLWETLRSLGFS